MKTIEFLFTILFLQIHSDSFVSILGPPAFTTHTDLTTAGEFFISDKLKLILLQVRTPIANNHYEEFSQEIIEFVTNEGIKNIVILSSTFSYEQHFIGKNPFEYLKNEKIENNESLAAFESSTAIDKKIGGSGVALTLFEKATESGIGAIILYKYTSEGDNRPDAFELTKRVNDYLKKPIQGEIKEPTSWKFLFGGRVNPELY